MTFTRAGWEGLPHNVRGAVWMLASSVFFSVMAILVKFLGEGYSPALETFYRQAAGFVVLLPLILRQGRAAYRATRPGILLFRAASNSVAMILSFYAFQKMPLAEANALSFTRALFMVPLAAFVVREQVGPLRVGAAVVGFGGVLAMLQPWGSGSGTLGVPAMAMLGASLLFSLSVTGMKVLTRDHAPSVLLVWAATLGVVFTLPGALLTWRWPDPLDFALLCSMGALGTASMACYIKGMQAGDAAAMAPIDYTRLVFAALAGFLLFGELPSVWTYLGAALVVGSTLFITLRELALARSARLSVGAEVES